MKISYEEKGISNVSFDPTMCNWLEQSSYRIDPERGEGGTTHVGRYGKSDNIIGGCWK